MMKIIMIIMIVIKRIATMKVPIIIIEMAMKTMQVMMIKIEIF